MVRAIGLKKIWVLAALIALTVAVGCNSGGNAPPCAADDVSCIPRDVSGAYVIGNELPSGAAFGLQIDPPSVEEVLEKGPDALGLSPVHIAVRATVRPGSVRCDWHGIARTLERREDEIRFLLGIDDDAALPPAAEIRRRFMSYVDRMSPPFRPRWTANISALADGGVSFDYFFLSCYVDYTVQEYLLGNGPDTLTVTYGKVDEGLSYDLYSRSYAAGGLPSSSKLSEAEFAAAEQGAVHAAESWLGGIVEGRESVVFLAPLGAHGTIVVEAWQAVEQWDLQMSDAGPGSDSDEDSDEERFVMAVRYGVSEGDPEHTQTLANLKTRITTATASDAHANDRIANVNGLNKYYRDIGAYGDITPDDGSTDTFTPAQPPPVLDCAGGTAVTDTSADRALVHDCETLLYGKDTLQGSATLDWGADSAVTDWEGVTVAGTPSRVTKLLLSNEGLSGTIPPQLGRLFELTHLDLGSNSLTGSIPLELGLLYNLQEIRLSGNSLTGCIPAPLKDVPTNDLNSLNLVYCTPAPAGLSAGTVAENSVPLSWTAVYNTSKYRVEYRPLYARDWVVDDDTITGTSRTVEGLRCETEYLFQVSAYGSGTTYAAAWSSPSAAVTATTTECVSPVFEEDPYEFSAGEDAAIGTEAGVVSATDPQDDAVTYLITAGNEDGKFAIHGSTGAITIAAGLDHETTDVYMLTIEAVDGNGGTAAVTVTVTVMDVAEAPSFDEAGYSFEVAEDASVGDAAGTVSATDQDENDTLSYAITAGNADGKFAIDDGTGAITVAVKLDHEATDAYMLAVEVSDSQGGTATVTVTVTVTDVAEAPSFDEAGYSFDIAANAATASPVGTVSATDPDTDDTLTYSITSGNSGSKFSIGSSTGEVTVAGTLDPDVLAFYVLTIEARDGSGGTTTATVEISLILSDCSNGTVVPRPDQNPRLVRDCSLLLAAKDTLAGTADLNWDANLQMTRWQGVTLDRVPSLYVRDLVLTDLSLTGSIPATLGGLADLRRLDLDENALTGNIPPELGRLRDLRHLYLHGNRLTRGIPHQIGNLGNLEFLYLYDNRLTGGIPPGLARLSELRVLLLDNNRLTGGIPSELGGMDSLEQLYLRDNLLTGEIPPELAGLSSLEDLYLEGNGFTGCIPGELQGVEDNDLDLLELTYCATSGSS